MKRTIALASLALTLAALPALGQQTAGRVDGFVTDPDGRTLPGVTVVLDSPATGIRRTTVTSLDGRFRLVSLPVGEYTLTASLAGFQTSRRELRVSLGAIETVSLQMAIRPFSDTIEVQASRVREGARETFHAVELDRRAPLAVEAAQVALLQPGVIPAASQFYPAVNDLPADCRPWWSDDLPGWGTPGQVVMSIGGASVAENSYLLDGLAITDFSTGLGASFVPIEFVEEIRVQTGGLRADSNGALGGVINMVTRRGTNQLHGSLSAYAVPETLQSAPPDTPLDPNRDESRDGRELNASLGGRVVFDTLFFFLFGRYVESTSTELQEIWGIRQQVSDPFWGARLDWNITARHHLQGMAFSDETRIEKTRFDYDPDTGVESDPFPGVGLRGGRTANLGYTGILTDRLLVNLQAGVNTFDRTNRSQGDECPQSWQAVWLGGDSFDYAPVGCWAHGVIGSWEDARTVYRLDADWLVGRHSLGLGAGWETVTPRAAETFSGGVSYTIGPRGGLDYPGVPEDATLVQTEHLDTAGDYRTRVASAYAHDTWTIARHLTIDAGLRWERYDYHNAVGNRLLDVEDAVAPRVGLTWDPTGAGRSTVYATAGLYNIPVPAGVIYGYGLSLFHDLTLHVLDGEVLPDGSPSGLGQLLYSTVFSEGELVDPREIAARTLKPITQREVIVGFDRMLGRSWSVGVRGIARRLEHTIEDFTINDGLEAAYGHSAPLLESRNGNPGEDFAGFYDLDGDGELDPIFISAGDMGYPVPVRDYYAVDVTAARRFSGRWALQGSYTWSHLYGNYEGLVSSDFTESLSRAVSWSANTWAFWFPGMLDNAWGDLPNDRRHLAKLLGSYAFDWGLQLGGAAFYSTGRPINSFGSHPTDPWSMLYYGFFTGGVPRPRGSMGRTDDVWSLDVMLRYDRRLAGIDWYLRADAFNVFDNHTAVEVDEIGEWGWGPWAVPNETWGLPTAYQTPRTIRLGFGLAF